METIPYKKIGNYEIKSVIANNGSTLVLYGHEPGFEEHVAIKILPAGFWLDAASKKQYERAMQTVSLLRDPAIVPIYDLGELDGRFYIIMRYMPGGTLADMIAEGPVSLEEAYRILYYPAMALEAAHKRAILHNNLKASNILFDENGDSYLSDFCLNQPYSPDSSTAVVNTVYRTASVMSPEQTLGSSQVDSRSDVYALGVILFQMLTGRLPFSGDSIVSQAVSQVNFPPPNIRLVNPQLPPSVEGLIDKAMAKDPTERFQTPSEFIQALAEVVQNSPDEQIPSPGKKTRSSRWLGCIWLAAFIFIFTGVLGVASYYFGWIDLNKLWNPVVANLPATLTPTAPAALILPTVQPIVALQASPIPKPSETPVPVITPAPQEIPASQETPAITLVPTEEKVALSSGPIIGGADKIAFINNNDVYTADLDGKNFQRQTDDEKNPKQDLKWTENGLQYTSRNIVKTIQIQGATGVNLVHAGTDTGNHIRYSVVSWDNRLKSTVQETAQGGKTVEAIFVYDRKSQLLDIIPGENFEMRGYIGPKDAGTIPEFGWDGDLQFALHGDVRYGFGDFILYNLNTKQAETINPIKGQCCYQDIQWSPDGTYILFSFQNNQLSEPTRLYYIPVSALQSGQDFTPIQLPFYFFSDLKARVYPVLRPVKKEVAVAPTTQAPLESVTPVAAGGADQIAVVNNLNIWKANLDGKGFQQVTSDNIPKYKLQWLPGGSGLVYSGGTCWFINMLDTGQSKLIGCYGDLSITRDGEDVAVSDNVSLGYGALHQMSFLMPYNLTRLAHTSHIDQSLWSAGFELPGGRQFQWSLDKKQFAEIVTANKVDEIQVFNFKPFSEGSTIYNTFPASFFDMRGYNIRGSDVPVLQEFGWNGSNLFALHGEYNDNNFGDLVVYDMAKGLANVINPIRNLCCYQDIKWSPDGSHLLFTFQAGDLTQVYYLPYDGLSSTQKYDPISFPPDAFADPSERVYPALRPVDWNATPVPVVTPVDDPNFKVDVQAAPATVKLDSWATSLAFSPINRQIASVSGNKIYLWDAAAPDKPILTFKGITHEHTDQVLSLAFHPGGEFLASAGVDRKIIIWYLTGEYPGTPYQDWDAHQQAITSLAFSPDGKWLASGSVDQTIKIWNWVNAGPRSPLLGHTGAVSSIAFSPDGQYLASGSVDKTVRIWRMSDGQTLQVLTGHTRPVWSVAFSPDGKTLATASWDGTIRLWKVSDWSPLQTLIGHTGGVESIAFSPDSQLLLSGSDDGSARLWRVSDGALIKVLLEPNEGILSVAFSRDGKMIATGSFDKKFWITTISR